MLFSNDAGILNAEWSYVKVIKYEHLNTLEISQKIVLKWNGNDEWNETYLLAQILITLRTFNEDVGSVMAAGAVTSLQHSLGSVQLMSLQTPCNALRSCVKENSDTARIRLHSHQSPLILRRVSGAVFTSIWNLRWLRRKCQLYEAIFSPVVFASVEEGP